MKPIKFGAAALAAALLCAPCLPTSAAAAFPYAPTFQQGQDTPPDVEQAMFSKGQTLYKLGKVEEALESGDKDAALKAMKAAEPELMRGASKGVIHSNTARRKVSRLAKRVAKLQGK